MVTWGVKHNRKLFDGSSSSKFTRPICGSAEVPGLGFLRSGLLREPRLRLGLWVKIFLWMAILDKARYSGSRWPKLPHVRSHDGPRGTYIPRWCDKSYTRKFKHTRHVKFKALLTLIF